MRVYLDWNATTPPLAPVIAAMHAAAERAWGNPASVHTHGRAARAHVEDAREAIAALAGVDPRDVVLTSGGTEANNLALRSAFARRLDVPPRLVTSRLEHPSITRVAEALEREGLARVHWLRVTAEGLLDCDDLERALKAGPVALVTLQTVNHETGVLQPVADVTALAREHGARVHLDAVQGWGKLAVAWQGASTVSLAGHKMRGPKGIGALVARVATRLEPVLLGGAQERGLRPGTVDPVACAGLTIAARHARGAAERHAELAVLRDTLERRLVGGPWKGVLNGTAPRAAHVSNLAFAGWTGPDLVAALDLEGVSVSSGSACSAGTSEPSPVLTAMVGAERAMQSVRISLGEGTTPEEIGFALDAFARVLGRAIRT